MVSSFAYASAYRVATRSEWRKPKTANTRTTRTPPDASAVRDAVGALKNLAEWPQARKQIAKIFRREGADKLLVEGPNGDAVPLFDRPITDGGVWPESERFVHQNIAPGGAATKAEAAVRARWGYPAPLASE